MSPVTLEGRDRVSGRARRLRVSGWAARTSVYGWAARASVCGCAPARLHPAVTRWEAGTGRGRRRRRRRQVRSERRGDPLPGAAGNRVQAPEPPAPPALMPLRPPLQPRSRAPRGRRRPAAGRRRDLQADAAGEQRQAAAAARRAHADPRAGAAASPRLEEGCARTLEPRPGGSPAPWKQPLPAPEPGVVASPPLWCFCSRRWKSRAQARCERRRPMRLGRGDKVKGHYGHLAFVFQI